jgi:hypothetical protein
MAGGLDRTRRDSYPSRYGTTEAERKSNVQVDAKLHAHLLGLLVYHHLRGRMGRGFQISSADECSQHSSAGARYGIRAEAQCVGEVAQRMPYEIQGR